MPTEIAKALPIACALFLVRFLAAEAQYQRGIRTKNGLCFPVGIGLRITLRLGGPLAIFVAYKMTQQATSSFDYFTVSIVALFGFGFLMMEPGEIRTSAKGLVQTSIFGLVRREVNWSAASASASGGLHEVLVIGVDGSTITHSQYHVGQSEFVFELLQHGVYVQGVSARIF